MRKIILMLAAIIMAISASAQNELSYQALKLENVDGLPWAYYDCDSLWVYLSHEQIKQYGKYHKIEVYIENHSDSAVSIDLMRDFQAQTSRRDGSNLHEGKIFNYKEAKRRAVAHQIVGGIGIGAAAAIDLLLCDNNAVEIVHDILDHGYIIEDAIDYSGMCIQKRKILKNEYMRSVTIGPGESFSSFFLISRESGCRNLYLTLTANNTIYRFAWYARMHHMGEIISWY